MHKDFVTDKIALKLKEIGFQNFTAFGNYYKHGNPSKISLFTDINTDSISNRRNVTHICRSPLWQQVIDWLRENHKINIFFDCEMNASSMEIDWFKYRYKIYVDRVWSNRWLYNGFKTYEEARIQAILKAIEIITQNETK